MKSILPILVGLATAAQAALCQAQASAPAPPAGPAAVSQPAAGLPTGNELVAQVVQGVDRAPSIAAKLRHRVQLVDRPLLGTGIYLQQGRGDERSFRLDIELRTVLFATKMQQASDGRQLLVLEEIDGVKRAVSVDLNRLRHGRPKSQAPPVAPTAWLTLGGLPKLLVHLQQSFHFERVVENSLDELRVWSVEGVWSGHRLAQFLPDQRAAIEAGQPADLNQLAPNVPHRVVMHVGCDDRFPYRIEYWRTSRGEFGQREDLMVVLEFYEVQIAAPVTGSAFVLPLPEGVTPQDRTEDFLTRFGLEDPPAAEANRRRRTRL